MKILLFIPLIFLTVNCFSNKITTMQIEGSDTSIVALRHFNFGSGSTSYDTSLNNNLGTIAGALWVDGLFGKALDFDGVSDSVSTTLPLDQSKPFTYLLWAYPEQHSVFQRLENQQSVSGQLCIQLRGDNNKLRFFSTEIIGGALIVDIDSDDVFTLNVWHFITITYDGTTVLMYINGVKQNETDTGALVDWSAFTQFIGSRTATTEEFVGKLEEFVAYNRALSQGEINYIYSRQVGINQ